MLIIAAATALVGCGSAVPSPSESRARLVLDRARAAMGSVKSVKEAGSNVMTSEDASIPYQKVTFTSEMDLAYPTKPLSHTTLRRSGNLVDIYSEGGFLYSEQDGKWEKVRTSGTSALNPTDLVELTSGARNPRVSSTSASYRVSFDVDPKTLEKLDLLDTGTASGTSTSGGPVPGLHMSADYTIARDTHLVQAAKIVMSMPDVTGEGNTTGTLTVKLFDFNKPVSVIVPTNVKSAPEK